LTETKKSPARSVIEFVAIVVVAIGLALAVQAWIVKPYKIPSLSMYPTLHEGQRILVDRIGMHFTSPHIGEIMVFHPPANYGACADAQEGETDTGVVEQRACDVAHQKESTVTFVKRVVGLPGDHIQIINGRVIRNGKAESAPYAVKCDGVPICNFPKTIIIPKGDYYMMGDNRPDSEDSRFWGPVPRAWLIGDAFLTYWPIDRIGFL
jgi:signal peptidase I